LTEPSIRFYFARSFTKYKNNINQAVGKAAPCPAQFSAACVFPGIFTLNIVPFSLKVNRARPQPGGMIDYALS
jgi:hypothetical protein